VNGRVPDSVVAVVVVAAELDSLLDSHVCGLYAWHVELCASAALGTIISPMATTKITIRFMSPFR
jgi:hypothetical protein